MRQPTNTGVVRSQVALSNPPIVFRFEREWTDAKIQAFGSHDCNVIKNAALQLSNGPSVNRGAFGSPCGRMPLWLELALMLVLSQNRAHDMRVILKLLNRKETNTIRTLIQLHKTSYPTRT